MPKYKYRPANDKRYYERHKHHRKYLTYRSMSRTFIRKYAKPNDVSELRRLWNKRVQYSIDVNGSMMPYEQYLIKKLRVISKKYTKYMLDFANYEFPKSELKECMVNMGQMEAYCRALMTYDHSKKKFCKTMIKRGNQLSRKAYHMKRK